MATSNPGGPAFRRAGSFVPPQPPPLRDGRPARVQARRPGSAARRAPPTASARGPRPPSAPRRPSGPPPSSRAPSPRQFYQRPAYASASGAVGVGAASAASSGLPSGSTRHRGVAAAMAQRAQLSYEEGGACSADGDASLLSSRRSSGDSSASSKSERQKHLKAVREGLVTTSRASTKASGGDFSKQVSSNDSEELPEAFYGADSDDEDSLRGGDSVATTGTPPSPDAAQAAASTPTSPNSSETTAEMQEVSPTREVQAQVSPNSVPCCAEPSDASWQGDIWPCGGSSSTVRARIEFQQQQRRPSVIPAAAAASELPAAASQSALQECGSSGGSSIDRVHGYGQSDSATMRAVAFSPEVSLHVPGGYYFGTSHADVSFNSNSGPQHHTRGQQRRPRSAGPTIGRARRMLHGDAVTPGPAAYHPQKLQRNVPGGTFSGTSRANGSVASTRPGPASYNIEHRGRPRSAGPTIGRAPRHLQLVENATPGPASYFPQKAVGQVRGGNYFGTSHLDWRSIHSTPGPGDYAPQSKARASSAGPTIGRAKRHAATCDTSIRAAPGPTTYNPQKPASHVRGGNYFGTSHLDWSSLNSNPGPGAYRWERTSRPRSAGPSIGRGPGHLALSTYRSPGPAAYTPQEFRRHVPGGNYFGTSRTDWNVLNCNPGPAAYAPEHQLRPRSACATIGTGPGHVALSTSISPGPAAYSPSEATRHIPGGNYFGTSHIDWNVLNNNPGPAEYAATYQTRPRSAGPTIGRGPGHVALSTSISPGPAAYSPKKIVGNIPGGNYFGTSRTDWNILNSNPGPADYATKHENRPRSAGPTIGRGPGHVALSTSTSPGPAAYSPKKVVGNIPGGNYFGTSRTDWNVLNSNPGPADYANKDQGRPRSAGPTIGRGPGHVALSTSISPGPAAYSPKKLIGNIPGGNYFGTSRTDWNILNRNPGPTDYANKDQVRPRSAGPTIGRGPGHVALSTSISPGPAAYSPKKLIGNIPGGNYFGTSRTDWNILNRNPGPTDYANKDQVRPRSAGPTIGRGPGHVALSTSISPGPAAYSPKKMVGNIPGGNYFGTSHDNWSVSNSTPGPADYNVVAQVKCGAAGYSIGRSPRHLQRSRSPTPGPASYSPYIHLRHIPGGGYFGTGRSDWYDVRSTPGPGDYDTMPGKSLTCGHTIGRGPGH
eukprot:TRINITY_DN701_c0_g1_i1.p1 TRINITY_DN701_c0_g1~~TRINITY_DN701_c0_g1_i1.p1  ORF type:complete len:1168 (+),score=58.17 TRINITY_DN701_c0_g1_i1:197-3700(+)